METGSRQRPQIAVKLMCCRNVLNPDPALGTAQPSGEDIIVAEQPNQQPNQQQPAQGQPAQQQQPGGDRPAQRPGQAGQEQSGQTGLENEGRPRSDQDYGEPASADE